MQKIELRESGLGFRFSIPGSDHNNLFESKEHDELIRELIEKKRINSPVLECSSYHIKKADGVLVYVREGEFDNHFYSFFGQEYGLCDYGLKTFFGEVPKKIYFRVVEASC